jgi:hypothetical protein
MIPGRARALDFNLIPNGDFDDLADMDIVDDWYEVFPLVSEMNNISGPIVSGFPGDVDDCVDSGAADGINTNDVDAGGAVYSACATEVVEGETYVATGYFRFPTGTADSRVSMNIDFMNAEDCLGTSLGSNTFAGYVRLNDENPAADWKYYSTGNATAPTGSKSIRVDILLNKDNGSDPVADVYFDKIYVTKADFIFAEDFEFDDVACRWSNEVGFAP